ncbi:MAG: hypothetical protein RL077_947 [Verrucomicrobiota bacterium]
MRGPLDGVILWCAAAEAPEGGEAWCAEDPRTRAERLKLVVQPARFCLLKPNLAGRVLGRAIPAGVVATKSPAALRCSRRASSIPSASVAPTKGPSAGTKRAPPRAIAARVPEDDTADASLKILWLKARRPDAVLMLRAPQPLPPMAFYRSNSRNPNRAIRSVWLRAPSAPAQRPPPPHPPFCTNDCGRAEHRALPLDSAIPFLLGFPHAASVVTINSDTTDKRLAQSTARTVFLLV